MKHISAEQTAVDILAQSVPLTQSGNDEAVGIGAEAQAESLSPSSCSATTPEGEKKDETGWLIEKDDTSHPKYLTICERRWDWSHDHQQAIRFSRKHDAEIIATHFLLEHAEKRIAEHAWDVSLIPVDGSPSVGNDEAATDAANRIIAKFGTSFGVRPSEITGVIQAAIHKATKGVTARYEFLKSRMTMGSHGKAPQVTTVTISFDVTPIALFGDEAVDRAMTVGNDANVRQAILASKASASSPEPKQQEEVKSL